jgi:hypothetical protein
MATINATTAQGGYLQQSRAASYLSWEDTLFNVGSATSADVNGTYIYTRAQYVASFRNPLWVSRRSYLVFDTSAITGTLTSLSLNVFVNSILDTNYTPDMIVEVVNSPTLSTALTVSDWAPYSYGAVTTATALGNNTWNTLTMNSTGLSQTESNNEVTFCLKDNYYDYAYYTNLTDPFDDGYIEYRYNYSGYVPYLDYTMTTGYGQTVNGIITANYQNIDGVSKMSISKVLGV